MPVPKRLLLDTDIVIQLLKKHSDVFECFIDLHEPAILIMTKFAVIPAWMPESSAMDGNLETSQELDLA